MHRTWKAIWEYTGNLWRKVVCKCKQGFGHQGQPESTGALSTDDEDAINSPEQKGQVTSRDDSSPTSSPPTPEDPPREPPLPPIPNPGSDHGESPTADESDTGGHGPKAEGTSPTSTGSDNEVKGPKPPRRSPGKRNGPQRTKSEVGNKDGSRPRSPRRREVRPELICRMLPNSLQWDVILSADDESRIAAVRQNGEPLSLARGGWPLTSFAGRLSIETDNGKRIDIPLFDETALIFKLKKDWSRDGRRITRLTRGHFIVIAPLDWTRSGRAPVEPHGCTDSEFMAHYFFRDGSESPQLADDFPGHELPSSAFGLTLSGKRVFDDSDQGDLFVERSPRLDLADRVVWARAGEEAVGGWNGCNFKPSATALASVLNDRQGRFFVRVYDERGDMLDGTDFRFLRTLREIRVNGEPYSEKTLLFPTANGHQPTTVRFISADGSPVRVMLPPEAVPVADGTDSLIAQAHPEADKICCALEANGGSVDIVLHLPRIWWRMEREDVKGECEWRSTPFKLTRRGFRECADSNFVLRLRLPKRIRSVVVGFGDKPDRKDTKSGDELVLRLDHFVDHDEIANRLAEDALFNVQFDLSNDGRGEKLLTLIRVLADPPPTIVSFRCEPGAISVGEKSRLSWRTSDAQDVRVHVDPGISAVEPVGSYEIAPLKTTAYTLRLTAPGMNDITRRVTVRVRHEPEETGSEQSPANPTVQTRPTLTGSPVALVRRSGGGWRLGKGFSRWEVSASGLRLQNLSRMHRRTIRIDTRRRTEHPVNVEALRRLADD